MYQVFIPGYKKTQFGARHEEGMYSSLDVLVVCNVNSLQAGVLLEEILVK